MTKLAEGTFEIQSWEQEIYDESEPGLVRATVKERYDGDVAADAEIEYLMTNLSDALATFVGQIRLAGRFGDKEGTVVLHETGEYFGGNTARGALTIVSGSGTGGMAGIRGSGAYVATHADQPVEYAGRLWQPTAERIARYVFDYDFD